MTDSKDSASDGASAPASIPSSIVAALNDFLKLEESSGILLMVAAVLAIVIANSPLTSLYDSLASLPVAIQIGTFEIAKPLLLWINDGLMAVFFFLVGLELKREFVEGHLSEPSNIALPAAGAIGGMAVPAAIYAWLNWNDPVALQGWAIPAATDIAFALAILALLGDRVPTALRVTLVTMAIFDDVGAIVIIAIFYTDNLSLTALTVALSCLVPLAILNRRGVLERTPYVLLGIVMWAALLKSGVHATLAGVALAFFIPMRSKGDENAQSPLHSLEHDLHTAVAFAILPLFAFFNAGITLTGLTLDDLAHPVTLGIILGLFVGKQVGVFVMAWLAVKLRLARLPEEMGWIEFYGLSALCGVGFTMSLFIGSLAFENTGVNLLPDERLGIIVGSVMSAAVAVFVLHLRLPRADAKPAAAD